ncbi:MAG TPA: asparagine synthase (glutamine-hydrolyzing) [Gemmatimonadaceae bacterium]|nr:asparagine synthase (glutamine-hydrolyzing) [Gemmatimonadaceae bacterium]
MAHKDIIVVRYATAKLRANATILRPLRKAIMCGVAGLWDFRKNSVDLQHEVRAMTNAIAHRGPDADGHWLDAEHGLALGHRRLSILDLSEAGAQPMVSPGGRYVVSFNGEFYNWRDVRSAEESHGARWRGHSDTEVFLAACDRRGVRAAVEAMHGMFAMAIWDREQRELTLVRDRLGEKPLYYGWVDGALVFGSELKALRAHSRWAGSIDRAALTQLLRYMYIPAPHCIYENVRKLPAGTMLSFRAGAQQWPAPAPYWVASDVALADRHDWHDGSQAQTADALDALLQTTIGREMVADVPVGAFLSGGIDSSLIVALMQKHSARPVRTFTVGFGEPEYNEAAYARAVAEHLKTDHTEVYVSPREALEVIPRLPTIYDEPFADVSQIPTFLISTVARAHVTVALSGDGGDESFAGYDRYALGSRLWRGLSRVPHFARRMTAGALASVSPRRWDSLLAAVPKPRGIRVTGDRIHRLAATLELATREDLYVALLSHWPDPAAVVVGGVEPPTAAKRLAKDLSRYDLLSLMMLLDTTAYLPDDIFTKVDRASMAVSLETRAPFVDHAVVEFAWKIRPSQRRNGSGGKTVLRDLLARYMPRALFERPKTGFGVPIDTWLRTDLRSWAGDLLSQASVERAGLFEHAHVERKWREHQSGERNWQYLLWDVLMAQAWYFDQAR